MPLIAVASIFPALARADDLPKPTPLPSSVDILGLRPGQTPDQVRAIFQKAQPDAQSQEGTQYDPTGKSFVSQIEYVFRRPDSKAPGRYELTEVVDVIFSAPGSGNQSLAIQRNDIYIDDARPAKAATVQNLEQKYGKSPYKPQISSPDAPSESYVYNADGGIAGAGDPAYTAGEPCPQAVLQTFSSKCGSANLSWSVSSSGMIPNDPSRIASFGITLKDHALALKALAMDQAAAQQKRAQDSEHAPKPPL